MRLLEVTRDEIKGKIGLLPIGSIEQHGPHLPMGTDSIIAEWVSSRVEERLKDEVVLFPPIYYGCSKEHTGFPYLGVGYVTMINFLIDLMKSAERSGLSAVVIINAHGGNESVLDIVRREINMDLTSCFKVFVFSLVGKYAIDEVKDYHAGSIETSKIAYINKDLVREWKLGEVKDFTVKNGVFKIIPTSIANPYGIINLSGEVKIDVESGRKLLEAAVEDLTRFITGEVKDFINSCSKN